MRGILVLLHAPSLQQIERLDQATLNATLIQFCDRISPFVVSHKLGIENSLANNRISEVFNFEYQPIMIATKEI